MSFSSGFAARLVLLLAAIFINCSGSLRAQTPVELDVEALTSAELVHLLQGEPRELTEDFVAQLDGDQLRVSLTTRGLINAPNDELMVSLVQPSGAREDKRPDFNGEILFENVREGLAAIVVTADSLTSTSLSSLYAAIPVFVTSSDAGDALAAPPSPFEVPVAEVNPEELARDLNQNIEAPTSPGDLLAASDYDIIPESRFRVQRMADGSVQGRVSVPQRGYEAIPGVTRVAVYRGGQLVAATDTDEEGQFVLQSVPAGYLSLIATGAAGHAAYTIEVIEFQGAELVDPLSRKSESGDVFVATANNQLGAAGRKLVVFLIPPALMTEIRRILAERLYGGAGPGGGLPGGDLAPALAGPGGAPLGGGLGQAPYNFGAGYGGGYYGGGGGGGFGGGLGDFSGLISAGLGIWALSEVLDSDIFDDDDDFRDPRLDPRLDPRFDPFFPPTATPISPFFPFGF